MNLKIQNKTIYRRKNKIIFLYILLTVAIGSFLFSIFKTITHYRKLPSHSITISNRASRGSIISDDNYTLSYSQKTYKAIVRGESIKPNKKKLFIKLFSIYSGIDTKEIEKSFKDNDGNEIKGNIILSQKINSRSAIQLKSLSYKLRKLGIFRYVKNKNGIEHLYGLDIIEDKESRYFPQHDILSPIIGYIAKSDTKYIRPIGKKGLEGTYQKYIASKKDGYIKGKRDAIGSIIYDKNFIDIHRVNGMDLHLNIPLSVQRRVELMLDKMKESIDADEIIAGVMESKTGKVLALASSNRYDPAHIRKKDIPSMVVKAAEYPYEAGSVIKPLTLAIALEYHRVTPNTLFYTGYHKFQIGKNRFISDDDFFKYQTATDIIIHSSNIGISKISWLLSGKEFREGLIKFGIARPSGIDLSRDLPGSLKSLRLLKNKMHRANSSYGYGMMVTFAQLFKAYSAFNNNGIAVTPRLTNYLEDSNAKQYYLDPKVGNLKAISKKTATDIHNILLQVVKRGTGVEAQYPGLEVGGKTGTAHIVKYGHYIKEYHSSFYGFANDDKGDKYTIGVLVIKAKKPYKYFASKSAVPTFRHILDILVDLNYLKPKNGVKKYASNIVINPKRDVELKKPIEEIAKPTQFNKTNQKLKKSKVKKIKKVKHKKIVKKHHSPQELFENLY